MPGSLALLLYISVAMRGNKTTASVNTTRTTNLAESAQSTVETSTLAMYILAITTGALVAVIFAIAVVFRAAYFHKSYTTRFVYQNRGNLIIVPELTGV